ncbi:MAG: desulfoferrodoxin FeS4 iron-binding domain-containing protein [Candidatus Falkowbacteria bacterium]
MIQTGEMYVCKVCGNVVKVEEAGGGQLVCCGAPMVLQE